MSTPHDPRRIGEIWDPDRVEAIRVEIEALRDYVVVSGGWAWHYMTPPGHLELKHAHDHKDADLFVKPEQFADLVVLLKERGFSRTWTRFDELEVSRTFYRYSRTIETAARPVKVLLDLFAEHVPSIEVSGMRLVEPRYLLGLYGHKHTSDRCFAVRIAQQLLARGISPVGRPEMADYSAFLRAA